MRAHPSPRPPAPARRGVVGVLLLAVLLVGVVAMHAMGGSSTHHGGPAVVVGQEAPTQAGHAGASDAPDDAGHGATTDGTGHGATTDGTGHGATTDGTGHGAATAMCLMVLVGFLALVGPRRVAFLVYRLLRELAGTAGPSVRAATAPDLTALGICRT